MQQETTTEVRTKMIQALELIKEAVDLSVSVVQEEGKEHTKLWEDFVREFIRYTRMKSRETGVDLISLVSLARIVR